MERDTTNMGAYYTDLLTKLRKKIMEERRGRLARGVLLLQENAPAQKSLTALQENLLKFVLNWLPIYYLFPILKKHLKGKLFSTNDEAICVFKEWFTDQDTFF